MTRLLARLAEALLAPSAPRWHVGGYRAGTKPVGEFRLPPPSVTADAHRSP